MNKKIIIGSLFLLLGNAWATVTASIDRSQMAVGQSFTLTIDLPDSGDNPELDVLKSRFELYGTSTSSQTSIINGKVSSQNTFTVNLIPKAPGKQTIPAIKVGNDFTNPISIEVLPEANTKNSSNNPAAKDSSVYLEASTGKQNLYIGVPFLYTLKLYFSVPLANLSLEQINLDSAQIQPQGKSTQYQSTEDGKTYQVVEQKFLVTPTKAGKLTIPPARIKGSIADNNGNGFFPMMANKPFMANSKPVTVQIKPVPSNIPVMEWLPAKQLKAVDNWSQNGPTLKVGEPLTHTITLEALGIPATAIPELQIAQPKGVSAYPDKPQSGTNTVNNDLVGSKTFKIAYIPTKAGALNFPEIRIKWWDIVSDSLKTAIIPAKSYTVIIDPTVAGATPALLNNASEPTKTATNPTTHQTVPTPTTNIWFYLSILFAGLWLLTLAIAYRLIKAKPETEAKPAVTNGKNKETGNSRKTDNISIAKACQNQDIASLNKALLEWAKTQTKKPVYSLGDIKLIFNNQQLNSLLDELNAAIYKGNEFKQFDELLKTIETVPVNNPVKSSKQPLKELYPN